MDNIYYVYEWIRLDTNEPFYVGKGKENRCYELIRKNNQHFNNIVKSIPVVVNILHDNLKEDIAYDLECYYIWLYRDEIGYDLCNMNDGGEGQTLCGEKNPFYGKRHSENTKEKNRKAHLGWNPSKETREIWSKQRSGKNNVNAKDVICLTTKRIFTTLTSAGRYYNINNYNDISNVCKGKRNYCGKLTNGTKLTWRYLVWRHNKKFRLKQNSLIRR